MNSGAKLLDSDLGGVQAWRCAQTGLQRVLPGFCGQFFSGDWYVVLCAVTRGGALARQVFYWLGEGTIAEEQAAAQAVAFELDELLGGSTVVRAAGGAGEPTAGAGEAGEASAVRGRERRLQCQTVVVCRVFESSP